MMKTAKRIAGIFMAAAMMMSMTACGGEKESGGNKTATKPLNEITQSVMDCGIEMPEMVEVSADSFQFKYGISPDDYAEFSVRWAGSGGDADEICIIKAAEGKKDAVKEVAEKRLESQKNVFKDYVPAQYDKLCEAKVKTTGDYVYWVCTNDNAKAEETLLSCFE